LHFERVTSILAGDFVSPYPRPSAAESEEDSDSSASKITESGSFFVPFRQKDWYEGHSWASGIAQPAPLNGRNQESTSEAIAAYEAVGLYGSVMAQAWEDVCGTSDQDDDECVDRVRRSRRLRDVGRLLMATEIRSTDAYYHVRGRGRNEGSPDDDDEGEANAVSVSEEKKEEKKKIKRDQSGIYPREYTESVIGVMWSTMAQFSTWFGSAGYLAYGIQLLPLTPASEGRDVPDWAYEMYPDFADSCEAAPMCVTDGWSVLQLAILATVGHKDLAAKIALTLPLDVFESAGGDGHSLTNTLWYIATRPERDVPLSLEGRPDPQAATSSTTGGFVEIDAVHVAVHLHHLEVDDITCGSPEVCTLSVLQTDAGGSSCGDRIIWLVNAMDQSEVSACLQVSTAEFPEECGGCDPGGWSGVDEEGSGSGYPVCPPDICLSSQCPVGTAPFLCTAGPSSGGCSSMPWEVSEDGSGSCSASCELKPLCGA